MRGREPGPLPTGNLRIDFTHVFSEGGRGTERGRGGGGGGEGEGEPSLHSLPLWSDLQEVLHVALPQLMEWKEPDIPEHVRCDVVIPRHFSPARRKKGHFFLQVNKLLINETSECFPGDIYSS